MGFFIYLILFSCVFIKHSSSNYILCTSSCPQVTASFLEPLKLSIECQENNNITNIYDNALVCIINYRIDYSSNLIYVNFKASNDTSTLEKHNTSEILDQTIWLGLNQESNQPNLTNREYKCNTKKDCARQFYLNTIERLITDGISQLDKMQSKLYNQSLPIGQSTRRCVDSSKPGFRKSIKCRDGLCYAHYVNDGLNKTQSCNNDNTPTLFSETVYYLPELETNKREALEYKCNRNLCNSNQTIRIIRNLVNEYTNWNNIKKDENELVKKSSTIHRTVSYYLISLSLISLQILF